MAIPSTPRKRVRVQVVLRGSLKRRLKRAKHNKKPPHAARSLITPELLQQSARFTHLTVNRHQNASTEKVVKTKPKKKQDSITNQEQISNTFDDNIQSSKQTQRGNPFLEQIHCTKLDALHAAVPITKKDVNNSTTKLSPSLIKRGFSTIIRFNENSSVHPPDELQNRKKKRCCSPCVCVSISILLALFILGIIIAIAILLTRNKITTTTSTVSIVPTATVLPVCDTSNYTACSSVLYHQLNTAFVTPGGWMLVECCYVAPTVNQLTIELAVREDDNGYWMLDDVSALQNYKEHVSNGGFEYNLTNWTVTAYPNATPVVAVDSLFGAQHTGIAYLQGASVNAFTYITQTLSITRGPNVLISFWWYYFPQFGAGFGVSEISVSLS